MEKKTYEAGASAYTLGVANSILNYADEYGQASKAELENMPKDASVDQWKKKMEEIAEEFICTPRYFLMCWLAAKCLNKNLLGSEMELGEFPAFQYKPKGARKAKKFEKVTRAHALSLDEEELKKYITIFTNIVWENERPEEKEKGLRPYKFSPVFRRAFLLYVNTQLLTKEEGLQIAHMIRLSYEETCYFLVRAVENDGLDFTKSTDIIHAYCLLRGKSYGVFQQLEAKYQTKAARIEKINLEEKPEGFTAGMMPGSEVSGKKDDSGMLYERICQWEDEVISQVLAESNGENEAAGQEAEDQKTGQKVKADDPKKIDSVDDKFLAWLVSQAKYLDIPGKSALAVYRNLVAYAYHYTLEHDIRKKEGSNVGGDGDFLKSFPRDGTGKADGLEDNIGFTDLEDCLEDPDEAVNWNAGKSGFREICSMNSPYQLKEDMGKADYEKLVLNRLVRLFNKMSGSIFEAKHITRIMRYIQVAQNGSLESNLITDRIIRLLAGEIPVTKADMLFMVWLACNLDWEDEKEKMSARVWDFLDGGSKALEEGHLPELYIPHVLERTFILSLCIGNMPVGECISISTVHAKNPAQIYLALSAYVNSQMSQ